MDRVNEVSRDAFSTVGRLRASDEQSLGDPAALQRQLRSLMTDTMRTAATLGFSQHDVQDIGYVMTALLDEVIMLKGGAVRDYWAAHSLQLELFNDTTAGHGVFDRLNTLMTDPSRLEVLEIYYLVLLFGFQGQYRIRGGEIELGDVTDRARDAIRRGRGPRDATLSPHGARPDSREEGLGSSRSLLWAALAALAVTLVVYGAMAWLLSSKLDDVGDSLQALSSQVD